MTMGDMIVIAVLIMVVALIVRGMIQDKKKGKCCGCSGCPNYGSCRAHIGCTNNPNNRVKKSDEKPHRDRE